MARAVEYRNIPSDESAALILLEAVTVTRMAILRGAATQFSARLLTVAPSSGGQGNDTLRLIGSTGQSKGFPKQVRRRRRAAKADRRASR